MRIRLKLQALQQLLADSALSQNHWAIKFGLSKGHLSNLLSGKHPYPSARTRDRLLEVLDQPLEALFEIERGADLPDVAVHEALNKRYVIDRSIGQGGMGTVYLARDLVLGRPVALKVVNEEAVSGVGSQALLRELVHANRLQHPNILPVLDAGEVVGAPYYVMPYVRGGSLRDLLQGGNRLPPGQALAILNGMASALGHAHDAGVLHCDIKPANVLLDQDHPYLIDFGIARAVQQEVWSGGRHEPFHSGAGTPAYVSPEQARGDGDLDARADVYSLGCVMYEMLTGTPPFDGPTTMATVGRRFVEPPPRVQDANPAVPTELSEAIEAAMSLERQDRPASAREFAGRCRRAMQDAGTVVGVPAAVPDSSAPSSPARDLLAGLRQGLRSAWRSLARTPGIAVTIALTMALGIGLNVTVFSAIDRLFLSAPAHVRQPDTIHRLVVDRRAVDRSVIVTSLSYPLLESFRASNRWSSVAGFFPTRRTVGQGRASRSENVTIVSREYFSLLGVEPELGRFFDEADDQTGGEPVVVIGWDYWQSRFGGSPEVIGQRLFISDEQWTVVGVAPKGFDGIDLRRNAIFLPLKRAISANINGPWETSPGINWVRLLGRRAGGVSPEVAAGALTPAYRAMVQGRSIADPEAQVLATPLNAARGPGQPATSRVSLWLAGVAILLLIIACSNVINLMLARLTHREGEIAIRAALGAGRLQLYGLITGEALFLVGLSGLLGLGVAHWSGGVLGEYLLPNTDWHGPLSNPRGIIAVVVLVVLVAVLVSVIPAWRATRSGIAHIIKAGHGASRTGRSRVRDALLALQTTLSTLLLVLAGLFVLSLSRVSKVNAGMAMDQLALVTVDLPSAEFDESRRLQVEEELREAIEGTPGVVAVTGSNGIFFNSNWAEDLRIPGHDSLPRIPGGGPYINLVSGNYFEAMGTGIIRGRPLTTDDQLGTQPVTVVGATMARLIWGDDDPIGQCMIIGDEGNPCYEIVGIAEDAARQSLLDLNNMQYYVADAQYRPGVASEALYVRTSRPVVELIGTLRSAVDRLGPDVAPPVVRPLRELASAEVHSWELGATMFTVFGLVAAVVAVIGIYGVMTFSVARRTREFGLRIALGMSRRTIVLSAVRGGLMVVAISIGFALLVTALVARWVQPLLYETSAMHPGVLGAVALILVGSAALAAVIPAVQATRANPADALRAE